MTSIFVCYFHKHTETDSAHILYLGLFHITFSIKTPWKTHMAVILLVLVR